MGDDAAEFAFELADRVIDKGFDHLPTKWFGVSSSKTSKWMNNGKLDDRYEGHSSDDDGGGYDKGSRRRQNNDYGSRDNRDPYSPSSRSDGRRQSGSTVNRPRGGELPLSSRSDRYGYDDRDIDTYSPRSQRSSKPSYRDQREPASAREARPRPQRYRSDRAYDSDDDQSRSKKKPNLKVIALGAVAGGLVIGAIGKSALKERRRKKQEEDEVWDKKYGKNGADSDHENSDDEVYGSSSSRRRERRNNNGGSQQSLPLGGEDRSYRRRSMGGR